MSPSGSSSRGDNGDVVDLGDKKPDSGLAAGAAPGGESKHQGGFAPLVPPAEAIGDMAESRFVYRMASKSINGICGVTSIPVTPELLGAEQELPHADQLYCFTKSGQLDLDTRQILSALDHIFNPHLPGGQLRITNGLLESIERLRSSRLGEAAMTRNLLEKFLEFGVYQDGLPFWMTNMAGEDPDAPDGSKMTLRKFLKPSVWIAIARAINAHFDKSAADEAAYELKEIEIHAHMLRDLIDRIKSDPDAFWQQEFESGGSRKFKALRDQPDSLPAMVLYGLAKGWQPMIMEKLLVGLRNYFAATPGAAVYFHTTRSIIDWAAVSGMTEQFCKAVTDKAEATIRGWQWIAEEQAKADSTSRQDSNTSPREKSRDRGGYLPVEP